MENTLIQISENIYFSTLKSLEEQTPEFQEWFAAVSRLPYNETLLEGRLDTMAWEVDGFRVEEKFHWKYPAAHADNYVRSHSTFTITPL